MLTITYMTPKSEYIEFLKKQVVKLDHYFEQEKPYIVCKSGCSL